jgi:hypothetical protein
MTTSKDHSSNKGTTNKITQSYKVQYNTKIFNLKNVTVSTQHS